MNINHLAISWGVSRGHATYGYNICRLDDRKGHTVGYFICEKEGV